MVIAQWIMQYYYTSGVKCPKTTQYINIFWTTHCAIKFVLMTGDTVNMWTVDTSDHFRTP